MDVGRRLPVDHRGLARRRHAQRDVFDRRRGHGTRRHPAFRRIVARPGQPEDVDAHRVRRVRQRQEDGRGRRDQAVRIVGRPVHRPRPARVLGLSPGDARPARDRGPGLGERPAARRLRARGGLGQGGARVALHRPERPALPPPGPHQHGSVRVQGRGSGGVRAAALGSGRAVDGRPGGRRGHRPRAAGGGGGSGAHRRRDGRRQAAHLLRGQRDRLEHRRLHGAVRGRRPLPVLRPDDGTGGRSCPGIPTTPSARSTICRTPTSS